MRHDDLVLQAMGGIMSLTGYPDRPPVQMGVAMSDLAAGMFAAYACVTNEKFWAGLCELLEIRDLKGDPRYKITNV